MRLASLAFAAPIQAALLTGLLSNVNTILQAAPDVTDSQSFFDFLDKIPAISEPSSVQDATDKIQTAIGLSKKNPISLAGLLKLLGLTDALDTPAQQLSACGHPCTSDNKGNPPAPVSVYTQVEGDAPMQIAEEKLLAAMYFPPDYTNGKKLPILMIPGTGNYGQQSFKVNFGKKFSDSNKFDPVYLNVPNYLLDDIQDTAEFVAYAIKYLYATTNSTVAAVTWSQGAVDLAWTLQYWPSIRNYTTDAINLSANYKGTASAYLTCPLALCGDSSWQQKPDSKFFKALYAGGGSSAWIPTTSIMSLTDDVLPQIGGEKAAGYIYDERHVGVSNTFIQQTCAFQPGGIPYSHEGIMFSNLAYDLAVDALTHDGPGQVSRLDLKNTCSVPATKGLTVKDIIHTIGAVLVAAFNIGTHIPTKGEPPVRAYARS